MDAPRKGKGGAQRQRIINRKAFVPDAVKISDKFASKGQGQCKVPSMATC